MLKECLWNAHLQHQLLDNTNEWHDNIGKPKISSIRKRHINYSIYKDIDVVIVATK